MPRTKRVAVPNEHREQVVFMERVAWQVPASLAELVWANPNGGLRDKRTAARLKAEGVKPGVPDVTVAIARGGFHGLWLELKRQRGGTVSKEQKRVHGALRAAGYRVEVCVGAEHAWRVLCEYLGLDPRTGGYDL